MFDRYLVIKTMVDKNENITNEVFITHKRLDAEIEFYSLIDSFYKDLVLKENILFEELDTADFGDEIKKDYIYEFKDYEGEINLKIELKTI